MLKINPFTCTKAFNYFQKTYLKYDILHYANIVENGHDTAEKDHNRKGLQMRNHSVIQYK